MTNLRNLVQYAVPVFTGILGLIWFFGRKKGKKRSIELSPKTSKVSSQDSDTFQEDNEANSLREGTESKTSITTPVPKDVSKDIGKPLNTNQGSSSENASLKVTSTAKTPDVKKDESTASSLAGQANGSAVKSLLKREASSSKSAVEKTISPSKSTEVSQSIGRVSSPANKISVSGLPVGKTALSTEQKDVTISSPALVSDTIPLTSNKVESSPVISRKATKTLAEQSALKEQTKSNDTTVIVSSESSDIKTKSSPVKSANHEDSKSSIKDSAKTVDVKPKDAPKSVDVQSKASAGLKDNSVKSNISVNNSIVEERISKEEVLGSEQAPTVEVEAEDKNGHSEHSSPPSSESPGCDSNSEASNDSGRGGSVTEQLSSICPPEIVRYEFNFPSDLCGLLIGRHGRNINSIKEESNAMIALEHNPYTPEYQICVVEGTQGDVEKALSLIRQKFPCSKYSQLDMSPINQPVAAPTKIAAPVLMPNIMQLSLPEGVSVDVIVSNIVDAGHIFVQQPTHPSFPSLDRLNQFMIMCYTQDKMVPPLPQPIEAGVICVAPLSDGWYRAQVVQVYVDLQECDIKFVDYGGFERVPMSQLKQIRSDFMTLPFQAVECYIATIAPLPEEEYFSVEAANVLDELTQAKVLQAQVITRAEDGIPCIHLYQISGNRVIFINRELVNRKVVKGTDIVE